MRKLEEPGEAGVKLQGFVEAFKAVNAEIINTRSLVSNYKQFTSK